MEHPAVSVIIPVKPGGAVRALDGLRKADYPDDSFEVLVAEGACPSRQRNQAAREARGAILFFLDDDSLVSPDFLRRTVSSYENGSVAVVGGPSLTPDDEPPLRQAFGLALASPFGGGSVCNRYRRYGARRETGDHELILCNLSMSAVAFAEAGGFDERLYPNEENELLVRLRRAGWKLIHDPDLAVYRGQRTSLRAFVRQLFGYGRGRAQQILLGGGCGIATFVPVLFLLYLLSLPFLHHPVYYLPLLCYLVMGLVAAVHAVAASGKTGPALLLPLLLPLLHLSYGAGLLSGLLVHGAGKRPQPCGAVTVKRVKAFGGGRDW
ncbi:MAG TPA: glycosyltransferase [Geobacteraceae bacterium]|nr:glycosyltransferase [Geobacteraceae bacterium]